jgi:putative spermidine/putrescine transport system ATP-binding protein
VSFVRDLGASVEITVRCGEQQLLAVTTPRERPRIEIGDPVAVELPAAACVVLPS